MQHVSSSGEFYCSHFACSMGTKPACGLQRHALVLHKALLAQEFSVTIAAFHP